MADMADPSLVMTCVRAVVMAGVTSGFGSARRGPVVAAHITAGSSPGWHMALDWAGSGPLLDTDEVAGGVAERAVANAVGLVGRLLHDLDVVAGDLLERLVHVVGCQEQHGVRALGHHLADRAPLVVGDARVHGRRVQDDAGVGL